MGIIAVVVNLVSFGLLLGVEALIAKLGWIPKRQPKHDPERPEESFLYLLDRDMFRIGNTIGLSLTAFAVGVILEGAGLPPLGYMVVVVLFATLLTAFLHWRLWLPQRKRDSGYPPGGVSLLGILHLPSFMGHVTWILLGLWHLFNPEVLGFILLGFLGGGIWLWASARDRKQKKFL